VWGPVGGASGEDGGGGQRLGGEVECQEGRGTGPGSRSLPTRHFFLLPMPWAQLVEPNLGRRERLGYYVSNIFARKAEYHF